MAKEVAVMLKKKINFNEAMIGKCRKKISTLHAKAVVDMECAVMKATAQAEVYVVKVFAEKKLMQQW